MTAERDLLHVHRDSEFLWQKHADRLRFLYCQATETLPAARATLELAEQRGLGRNHLLGLGRNTLTRKIQELGIDGGRDDEAGV